MLVPLTEIHKRGDQRRQSVDDKARRFLMSFIEKTKNFFMKSKIVSSTK